jgi:hypothetical protein
LATGIVWKASYVDCKAKKFYDDMNGRDDAEPRTKAKALRAV